jgi:hypothetical protein
MAGDPNHNLSGVLVAALRSDRHATNISGYKYFNVGFRDPNTAIEVTVKVIITDAQDAAMTGAGIRYVASPTQDNPNQNVQVTFGTLFRVAGSTNPEWRIENVSAVTGHSVEQ